MLPLGHLAAGALLGARRSRRVSRPSGLVIAGAMVAASVPDIDLAIPRVLDGLGIRHRLDSGVHHRWVTHTPLFWGLIATTARRIARRRGGAEWEPEAADLLAGGVALHLLLDSVANTVSLLWPLSRTRYGLGLDRMAEVTDHVEYVRRYPASPAGKLEVAMAMAAVTACGRVAAQRRNSDPSRY